MICSDWKDPFSRNFGAIGATTHHNCVPCVFLDMTFGTWDFSMLFHVISFERKSICSDTLLWQFPSKRVLGQSVFASCFMKTLHSIVPSFLPRSTCTNLFAKPRFEYQPVQFFDQKNGRMSPRKNAEECEILPVPTYLTADHTDLVGTPHASQKQEAALQTLPSQPPNFAKWCCKLRFRFTQGHVSLWPKWPVAVQIPSWHSHRKTFINISNLLMNL